MKEGWVTKKLGEVCNCIGGGTPAKNNQQFYGGNIPWATVRDLKSDIITSTEFYITKEALANSASNVIPKDNVIIATRVGLGKSCMTGCDIAINQDLKGIIPRDKKSIDTKFLFLWFNSIAQHIIDEGTGATVQGVKISFINDIPIQIPSFSEQQRIVSILDTAFTDIATAKVNVEKNIFNVKALFETELNDTFENGKNFWKGYKLGEVCTFFNGFAFKSSDAIENSDVQLIRMGNIYKNELNLGRSPAYYPTSFVDIYRKYLVFPGDIIFSLTGTTGKRDYGYAVMIPKIDINVLLNQRIAKVCPNNLDNLGKKFLLYYLRSEFFLEKLYATANGTRQANLSTVTMAKLPFFLPDPAKQNDIVNRLDELSDNCKKLEAIYTQKIALYDELKQSLLQRALSGEL